jgi:hypothetical protein
MEAAIAALLGALIVAVAAVAAAVLAARASIRASQLAARAPLGPLLHKLAWSVVNLYAVKGQGPQQKDRAQSKFERCWNAFATQQAILCPSACIEELLDLLRRLVRRTDLSEGEVAFAGVACKTITGMVAAHAEYLFRYQAQEKERAIMQSLVAGPPGMALNCDPSE